MPEQHAVDLSAPEHHASPPATPPAPLRAPVDPGRLRTRAVWAVVVAASGIVVALPFAGVVALPLAHTAHVDARGTGPYGDVTRRLAVVAIVLAWLANVVTALAILAVGFMTYMAWTYAESLGTPY
ncbi:MULTISPECIES: hypothetical protein [unclassified Isoptericola]|uniref:hypothetical protein n=1 Tax=unclassified Isoptericola TaxID=2623355 RepID=UPI003663990C